MSKLDHKSRLVTTNPLNIKIISSEYIEIGGSSGTRIAPSVSLRVLDAFLYPSSLESAMKFLGDTVKSVVQWVEITKLITELHSHGILQSDDVKEQHEYALTGFGCPDIHVAMLNDKTRTELYLRAIDEVVRPGDCVVDLGSGTGILAAASARRGAARVYAIEASRIASAASKVFESNNFSEKVKLVPGWSTQVELPERVDVMVSEIIGNDPFGERALDLTADARMRFLKEGARLIPSKLDVFAVPVRVPEDELARHFFTQSNCGKWTDWYGIDFSELAKGSLAEGYCFYIKPNRARTWDFASEPILIKSVDFKTEEWAPIDNFAKGVATRDISVNAVLEFFQIRLSKSNTLSVDPSLANESCSWKIRVFVLPLERRLSVGEEFSVRFSHGIPGRQNCLTIVDGLSGA